MGVVCSGYGTPVSQMLRREVELGAHMPGLRLGFRDSTLGIK